jgi:alcohol dehydrogenase class IV
MMGFFTAPRFCFGTAALEQLSGLGMTRVILVVDHAIAPTTQFTRIREEVAKTDARVETVSGIRVEPTLESVEHLAQAVRAFGPDGIVAVGGGSTIDTAKGAWVRYERPDLSLEELTPLTELKLRTKARFVAMPTTAGSGSEATGIAYFHRPDRGLLEVGSREMEPDWALLDPHLLSTLPPAVLATTGMDALAHALEAIASEWATPFTDALARDAVGVLARDLPRVVKHPGDIDFLGAVQAAAAMAGLAVANAQLGATHALAHALSAMFETPHAATVAVLLPYVVEFNFPAARDRYQTLHGALGPTAVQNKGSLGARLHLLGEQLGLPRSLTQVGIPVDRLRAQRARVIELASASPSLVGNPRMPSQEELGALLDAAAAGDPSPF